MEYYQLELTEVSDPDLSRYFIDDESESDKEISRISGDKRDSTHLEAMKSIDLIQ